MADEIIYWAPAASTEQASLVSKPETKEEIIYYTPPQTPQKAIEKGLVGWKAEKPKNFLPHWKRLGPSHKPKYWHCWWGCEGVQSVLDFDSKPTHDYYCCYWEMLLLFPDWEEDFSYSLYDRPPMPDGGPLFIEEEYNERKRQYQEAIDRCNAETERNPFNMVDEQNAFVSNRERITVSRSEKDRGKEFNANGIRTTPFSKQHFESGETNANTERSLSDTKPKQKRVCRNNKRST